MKALVITTMIIAGSLVASTGYSQVYINAHVGFGFPVRRVYCAPPPPPVEYQTAPVNEEEYAPAPETVYEAEFPGYAYYSYPAWNGHYRDRCYFEHYRPVFEREHRGYDHRDYEHRGYDRRYDSNRNFDHGSYERRDQGANRGLEHRNYEHRGNENRGDEHGGDDHRRR